MGVRSERFSSLGSTPLWPAGHLPLKGGDYAVIDSRCQSPDLQNERWNVPPPISPLEGEMAGRPEGGAAA
jgi:hypothetical protein